MIQMLRARKHSMIEAVEALRRRNLELSRTKPSTNDGTEEGPDKEIGKNERRIKAILNMIGE